MAWLAWLEWAAMRFLLYLIMLGSLMNFVFSNPDHVGHYPSGFSFLLCLGFLVASARGNNYDIDRLSKMP